MTEASPFIPGARVAISYSHTDSYQEGFIDKVYKTGNFTLRGKSNQWRPSSYRGYDEDKKLVWSARPTGSNSWERTSLKPWNADTDAEITASIALRVRTDRWAKLRHCLGSLRPAELTDPMLDQIEAALGAHKPEEGTR